MVQDRIWLGENARSSWYYADAERAEDDLMEVDLEFDGRGPSWRNRSSSIDFVSHTLLCAVIMLLALLLEAFGYRHDGSKPVLDTQCSMLNGGCFDIRIPKHNTLTDHRPLREFVCFKYLPIEPLMIASVIARGLPIAPSTPVEYSAPSLCAA